MRSNTSNYFIVGTFVVLMLAGLMVAIALLTGRTGATDPYFAVYDNVTGVKFGTQVLYEGFPIGQVDEVQPIEENGRMRFRVGLDVKEGWRIPDDSVAQITAPGLLSAITISIVAGRSQAPLKPGSRIPEREAANIFSVMSSVASGLGDIAERDIRPILGSVAGLLEGDAKELIRELTALAVNMNEQMPRIARNIDDFTGKMNESSGEIQALFNPENREKIEQIIGSLNQAAGNFAGLTAELGASREKVDRLLETANETVAASRPDVEKALSDLRYVIDSVARRIDSVNQNLEGASRNMYEFSRQIRQNPGLLLGSTPPKDAANER